MWTPIERKRSAPATQGRPACDTFAVVPQKYLTVDNVATLVQHRGVTTLPDSPPNTETGATIVCLHDAGSNGNNFSGLLDALAADHSPMAYDQPGHGRSANLDSLASIDAMVGHLNGLATAWSIDGPVLVGEGMGAAVALQAAKSHPNWPSALVLVGGVGTSFDVAADIESLSAITAGKARREFDRSGYAPDTDRSVYQKAFGDWVKTDPRATLGARRAQAEWSCTDGPDKPVLIVIGEHEEADHVANAEALAAACPNVNVERLAGAGRRGVIEQPEALAGLISSFLATNGVSS